MQSSRVSTSIVHVTTETFVQSKANRLLSNSLHLRYEIALLYLQQANYELDVAVVNYLADEKWEKEHPIEGSSNGRANQKSERRKFNAMTGLSGQV